MSDYKYMIRKSWKKFWKAIRDADVVLEVLDARDPEAFRLKNVEKELSKVGKRIILVINKADLVPRNILELWRDKLQSEYPTVFISARYRLGTGVLRKMIYQLAKRANDEIKVAVIGYPNVGKSALINILKGHHSLQTGAKPGLTKDIHVVKRGKLRIIDTPGVFLSEDEETLIYVGAIRVENLDDPIYYALKLINKLKSIKSDVFYRTYGVDDDDPEKLLIKIALKRKLLLSGGSPNLIEAAKMILRDWQIGKIVVWRKPSFS